MGYPYPGFCLCAFFGPYYWGQPWYLENREERPPIHGTLPLLKGASEMCSVLN